MKFSLVVLPIMSKLRRNLMWYLDDAPVSDSPTNFMATLSVIEKTTAEVGLLLNPKKCEVAVIGGDVRGDIEIFTLFEKMLPAVQRIEVSNATLLGSSRTDETTVAVLDDKIGKLWTLFSRLSDLSSHSAFFLLWATVSIPCLIYFLRCSPTIIH